MAKTTAPLLSFDASGQIGESQVYSSWKGRSYARRYVVPANPNTAAQQLTRNAFAWLQGVTKYMGATLAAAWDAYASNNRFTRVNGVIKYNLPNLRPETDLAKLILSPAANSGIPLTAATVTHSSGTLTVTATAPELPTGWTVDQLVAAAIKDQDPQSDVDYTTYVSSDTTAPYEVAITGLANGTLYRVGVWCVYSKPDGTKAYGEAYMTTGTPAA